MAIVASFVVAFTWRITVSNRSVPLLVAVVIAGIVGCSSVVTVYPFTAVFDPKATSALSAGMGLNGLVAAVLSIVQNPSSASAMRFSMDVYMCVVGCVLIVSLVAFCLLWKTKIGSELLVSQRRQEMINSVRDVERSLLQVEIRSNKSCVLV